jgi:hypothetical protein
VHIDDLPFAAESNTVVALGQWRVIELFGDYVEITGRMDAGTSRVSLYVELHNDGFSAALPANWCDDLFRMRFAATYEKD